MGLQCNSVYVRSRKNDDKDTCEDVQGSFTEKHPSSLSPDLRLLHLQPYLYHGRQLTSRSCTAVVWPAVTRKGQEYVGSQIIKWKINKLLLCSTPFNLYQTDYKLPSGGNSHIFLGFQCRLWVSRSKPVFASWVHREVGFGKQNASGCCPDVCEQMDSFLCVCMHNMY